MRKHERYFLRQRPEARLQFRPVFLNAVPIQLNYDLVHLTGRDRMQFGYIVQRIVPSPSSELLFEDYKSVTDISVFRWGRFFLFRST